MVDSEQHMSLETAQSTFSLARQSYISLGMWERFRSDNAFRARVSEFMRTGACAPRRQGPLPMHFGPLEWETFFSVNLTDEQWAAAQNVPWDPDLGDQPCPLWPGAKIGRTHFAFFGLSEITVEMCQTIIPAPQGDLPLDVEGIIRLVADKRYINWANRPRISNSLEQGGHHAPGDTLEMRWYCIPMSRPVSSRFGGHREETPEGYEVATMAEYLAAKVLYFQLYGTHRTQFGDGEYAPYAICGAPARQQREAQAPGYDFIYNQMVSQGREDGLGVGHTTLISGGNEWFTALARRPEQTA